jgi:hypothetical protein
LLLQVHPLLRVREGDVLLLERLDQPQVDVLQDVHVAAVLGRPDDVDGLEVERRCGDLREMRAVEAHVAVRLDQRADQAGDFL